MASARHGRRRQHIHWCGPTPTRLPSLRCPSASSVDSRPRMSGAGAPPPARTDADASPRIRISYCSRGPTPARSRCGARRLAILARAAGAFPRLGMAAGACIIHCAGWSFFRRPTNGHLYHPRASRDKIGVWDSGFGIWGSGKPGFAHQILPSQIPTPIPH